MPSLRASAPSCGIRRVYLKSHTTPENEPDKLVLNFLILKTKDILSDLGTEISLKVSCVRANLGSARFRV